MSSKGFDFKEHFCMTLAAPRASGKSYFIREFLKSHHAKRFDHIIIMCPSLDLNNDYDGFEDDARYKLISNPDTEIIGDLFHKQENIKKACKASSGGYEQRCPDTLLILDDCIGTGALRFRGETDDYATRGRHVNISLIIAVQKITSCSPVIRDNSDYFIIFCPYSVSELERFVEMFVQKNKRNDLYKKLRDIFDIPFQFIMVDNTIKNIRHKLKHSDAESLIKHGMYENL